MAPSEALYGTKCKSPLCWEEVDEKKLLGPEIIQMTSEKIDVILTPMKGVMRFGKKGKLSPRFFGPSKILKCIGKVAYELALLPTLAGVHDVFHVSMLRKYIPDPSHVLNYEPLKIKDNLTYEEVPFLILDHKDQVLRTKTISLVKIHWKHHTMEDASWE
ncbi:uncharacterized protein LOC126695940 [Quercus robur]|uniref:uncharacterized protein LOC126695940 n=1 Tax=Quercus robur TaxID=38942 RepID=UPI002161D295|nr:uncharacterized protein LOC126695940 [Quercus robur]